MSAETLVTGLNALYLVPMALISVVGTASLLKLISTFLGSEKPRRPAELNFSVEDA